jgi:hypothetical protein
MEGWWRGWMVDGRSRPAPAYTYDDRRAACPVYRSVRPSQNRWGRPDTPDHDYPSTDGVRISNDCHGTGVSGDISSLYADGEIISGLSVAACRRWCRQGQGEGVG